MAPYLYGGRYDCVSILVMALGSPCLVALHMHDSSHSALHDCIHYQSLNGGQPLPQGRLHHAILLPIAGRDRPISKAAEEKAKALKAKADARPAASTSSSTSVGAMADILSVTETADVLTIAGSEYSILKLREFFGHDKSRFWVEKGAWKHCEKGVVFSS